MLIVENKNKHKKSNFYGNFSSTNDHFFKFIQIYAVKVRTAKTTTKFVYDYILKFGVLLKLFLDKDPAFERELFQSLMSE